MAFQFIHHHFLYKLTLFANFDTLRKPYLRYGFSKEPILHGKRAYITTQNRHFYNAKQALLQHVDKEILTRYYFFRKTFI